MNDPYQTAELADKLKQSESIKQDMTRLLLELEQKVTGKSVSKPGTWRQHPAEWAASNLPDDHTT